MSFSDTPAARSIRQRLTNLAGNLGVFPMDALRLYFLDGFIARLAQTPYQQQFLLGGGLFLYKVVLGPARARVTQDSDFIVQGLTQAQIPATLQTIVSVLYPDELTFDPATVAVLPIMAANPQLGLRARFQGHLGQAIDQVTLDLAFEPVPWPGPQWRNVPGTLPQQAAIRLLTSPVEGIMAGKVEGMLRRGATNTRFKDYYDICRLAQTQDFVAIDLGHALQDICAHHQTAFVTVQDPLDGDEKMAV